MVMMNLFCAIVGETGSAFPVVVDESATVEDLKIKIKEKKADDSALKNVAAKSLQLFLAKQRRLAKRSSLFTALLRRIWR